jgi:hypothetical protein
LKKLPAEVWVLTGLSRERKSDVQRGIYSGPLLMWVSSLFGLIGVTGSEDTIGKLMRKSSSGLRRGSPRRVLSPAR